ncbi:MAG TPA: radical SAM protein, partial [Edaphobacter sp.]
MTPPTQIEATTLPEAQQSRPKIGFVSLGCPKNLVDSEVMMGLLHHAGGELTPNAEDAEILVVNTCSFIDSAKQESVNTILEMVQHKRQNGGRAQRLIVAGCLVERYRDEIQKNIPEVDAVVGTGELEAILAAAGLTPKPQPAANTPFTILPQGTPQSTIHTHAIGKAQTDAEVAHLIERAPSAVSQHSRPLADPENDREVAPQLKIVQSLAETGTTHGDEPLAHTGDHIAHIPNAGTKSRPEGDLRQQQGRFSRAAWDGATAALPEYLYTDATPRILTTPRASAYIKIAEGCDHPCSFCIIPQLRGKFRSRRMSSIIAEAENLIAQGVREITLIGQDTTCYGEDLGFTDGLATLLDALAVLPRLRWLRFLYTYPNKVTTNLLETMARHDNIAKYLDVPLQHASASVLKTMKRGGNAQIFLDLIEKA